MEPTKAVGYHNAAGMPMKGGSRQFGGHGGPIFWVMKEAWMPAHRTSPERLARLRKKYKSGGTESLYEAMELAMAGDHDGFAVFGRYPKGFLKHVLEMRLLGDVERQDILHVCSGTLSDTEQWTVDIRHEARPTVQADGAQLPFADATFPAIMIDPPYSDEYARNLYGVPNPRPSWLLREAARVVKPNGRIGLLHVAVPFSPDNCILVNVYGISTGVGFRIRAFTVFQRKQEGLPFSS